jgi:hypothetical protein
MLVTGSTFENSRSRRGFISTRSTHGLSFGVTPRCPPSPIRRGAHRATVGLVSEIDNIPYLQFLEPLSALLRAVDDFVGEAQRVTSARAGHPDASAPMIADLAEEQPYVGTDTMQQPIESVAMAASMSCFAGQDSLRSLSRLISSGPPPPLFAGSVLCRSAIDASRTAWWLTEHGIGTQRRMKRLFLELRYSAEEMAKVNSDPQFSETGTANLDKLMAYAAERGWTLAKVAGGGVELDGEARLTVRQFLSAEFGDEAAAQGVWADLSAVAHGAQHGLVNFVDRGSVDGNRGIIGTSTGALGGRLELAASAVAAANMRHLKYMGWVDGGIVSAEAALTQQLRGRAIRRLNSQS